MLDGDLMLNRDNEAVPKNLIMLVDDNDENFFGFWNGDNWIVLINQPDWRAGIYTWLDARGDYNDR